MLADRYCTLYTGGAPGRARIPPTHTLDTFFQDHRYTKTKPKAIAVKQHTGVTPVIQILNNLVSKCSKYKRTEAPSRLGESGCLAMITLGTRGCTGLVARIPLKTSVMTRARSRGIWE